MKYACTILTVLLLSCADKNNEHLNTALDFYDQRDYLNALVYFNRVDSTYFPCANLPLKAVCYRAWNWHNEAVTILENLKHSCAPARDTYINLSDSYHKLNRFDSAISIAKQGLGHFPKDPTLYYNLGVSYYKVDLMEPAYLVLREAIRIDSTAKEPYYILSQIHFDVAQDDSALYYINKTIDLDPNLDYYITRSQIFGAMNDYRNCIKDAQKVLAMDSLNYEGLFNRSLAFFKLGRMDSACMDYTKVYQLRPDSNLNEWVQCEGVQ